MHTSLIHPSAVCLQLFVQRLLIHLLNLELGRLAISSDFLHTDPWVCHELRPNVQYLQMHRLHPCLRPVRLLLFIYLFYIYMIYLFYIYMIYLIFLYIYIFFFRVLFHPNVYILPAKSTSTSSPPGCSSRKVPIE